MFRKLILSNMFLLFMIQYAVATSPVKILAIEGEVKIRHGLEETWHPAVSGMILENIDTILTLEGEVVLQTQDGLSFRLGSNAILDIGDLRRITRRDMFLYLTSQKINKLEPRKEPTKLRIGNVSVVHGESKAKLPKTDEATEMEWREKEINGAKALLNQEYYPNAVIKFHKILNHYSEVQDCGEVQYYLGKSFEYLEEPGQAIDAYQMVIEQSATCSKETAIERKRQAEIAIKKLNKE